MRIRTNLTAFMHKGANVYEIDRVRLQALRDAFIARGESIVDWAKQNNFRAEMVYAILAGRQKGLRGEGHKIAVALGLKQKLHEVIRNEDHHSKDRSEKNNDQSPYSYEREDCMATKK